ncbi:hypothetical protein Halha_1350 [Halobacteroides halobius DSM 5150]|uniref:Uncharacterized protein n=1 Tax=Halobacteroides halobius (strain ATCC 35273 / DSM 5150 / MD-1) TaxID=748449 RepID=L0K9V6_HALHC|nr:hypothetical protein [Halobacteroides halobius]AGB41295.1 hypothetical protein Halha_1350 [Halobacteroides halobius DSM 5150]
MMEIIYYFKDAAENNSTSAENRLKKTNSTGGDKMDKQCVDCPKGCPDGCPDTSLGPIGICVPPEDIEFCFTLVIPAGFSIPGDTLEERENYIEENFDLAAYFLEEEGCFECAAEECAVQVEFDGVATLAITEIFIEGNIKLLGGICVVSDSAPETGSQAPVCDSTIICVDEPTAVCVASDANCDDLRVIGAKNIVADLVNVTCGEFGADGEETWEIRGELEFACGECDIVDDC